MHIQHSLPVTKNTMYLNLYDIFRFKVFFLYVSLVTLLKPNISKHPFN